MADFVKADYPCAQKDLYSVLETGWGNFGLHLAQFTSFKEKYSGAYKTAALAALGAAEALPDNNARSGASELLHLNVVAAGKVCLKNFQKLKSYIEDAYADAAVQKIQFVIAGQNYYREASNEDWESVKQLNSNLKNYLSVPENLDALTDNNNMPLTFAPQVFIDCDAFGEVYESFKLAEETSELTAAKIVANNACYKTGISMLKDGQLIFEDMPEVRVKFVFDNLLALINPPVAGIKGVIKEAVTNVPVSGAVVTAQKSGGVAQVIAVDAEGVFGEQLAEGVYRVLVGAVGYVEQVFELDLKLTGLKTLNVSLVKTE